MERKRISFWGDEELLGEIDKARGPIPRDRWLREVVRSAIGRRPVKDAPVTHELARPGSSSDIPPLREVPKSGSARVEAFRRMKR